MNTAHSDINAATSACKLPGWLVASLKEKNTDFGSRVVCSADSALWLKTGLEGVEMRVMESASGPRPRLALQLKINDGHTPIQLMDYPDLEVFLQRGQLTSAGHDFCANWYFRLPRLRVSASQQLTIRRADSMLASEPVIAYLAIGQMQPSDKVRRRINTLVDDNWLPGPIDGTEVLPLHGHGTGNVMLVRWNKTTAFKTRIDPRGEELLVLKGAIHDAKGLYPQDTWIRNPIPAWQAWGAKAGTVIYYKNGHFAS